MRARLPILVLGLLVTASAAHASPLFVNSLAISGSLTDKAGTTVNDGRVGFFSDLYYDPQLNQYWALSDRGPGGGTLNFATRVEQFTIDVDLTTGAISNFQIAQTIKFTAAGATLDGIAPNPTSILGDSFDPEGFVIDPRTGNFLVSDEYGPSLYEFDRSGQLIKAFQTPANLVPRNDATNVPNFASDAGNTVGRTTNRGFEGLAITPDGHFAYAILQSAMLDEGAGNGTVNRIVKFDMNTGQAVAQYAYQLDTAAQGRGTSALVALNDTQFLVIERNNRGIGVGATLNTADKNVYQIDITGATDVTHIDLDAPGAVYTKVTKAATKFIDLDANTLALLNNKSPEKWEGLTIGPRLNDGGYLILAGTDNDYSVTQNGSNTQFDVYFRFTDADPYAQSIQCPLGQTTNCFTTTGNVPVGTLPAGYSLLPGVLSAYRASASDLSTYVAPVPEPGTCALLVTGLGALAARFRQRRGRAAGREQSSPRSEQQKG